MIRRMRSGEALDAAVRLVSVNVFLEVALKVFTFLLKAVCLRYVSTEVLGIANIRLLLMQQTIVFLSREPFRKSCIGAVTTPLQDIVNIVWFVPVLGTAYSLLFSFIWCFLLPQPDPDLYPKYNQAVLVYAFSAILELIAEPCYIVAQVKREVTPGVVIIGISTLNSCIITAALLINESTEDLTSFTIGQFAYGCSYLLLFYFYFLMNSTYLKLTFVDILPNYTDHFLNKELFNTTKKFVSQSVIKQLLTEGEKYIMTVFSALSYSEQGMYDVVNNLGSLCARIVFKPIEEGGYLYFSQSLSRNVSPSNQTAGTLKECYKVLTLMLHFVVLISVTVVVFGFSYSKLFLLLYGGELLATNMAVNLLRTYCFYLVFLAINGISECFTVASLSDNNLERYTFLMVIFSVVFLACSYFLSYYVGALGFILANCVNMVCRIVFCFKHILTYFSNDLELEVKNIWRIILPIPLTCVLLCVFGVICIITEQFLCCDMSLTLNVLHFAIGAVGFVLVVLSVFLFDADLDLILKDKFPRLQSFKEKWM